MVDSLHVEALVRRKNRYEPISFLDANGQHHLCLHDAIQLLVEMVKPYKDMFSNSFTFGCTI